MKRNKIRTNEISYVINWKNIDENFDVLQIKLVSEESYVGAHILDILEANINALSVLYRYGSKMLCLFAKEETTPEKLKDMIELERNIKVDVTYVKSTSIYDNEMIQLLLNTIANYDPNCRYNNLSGKLYYLTSDSVSRFKKTNEIYNISAYEIQACGYRKYSSDVKLNINVATFTPLSKQLQYAKEIDKEKLLKGPKYIFDENGTFRRKSKKDKQPKDQTFVRKTFNDRNSKPFLQFGNIDEFSNCKMGVLYQLLHDCEEFLDSFLQIELKEINIKEKYKKASSNLILKTEKDYFEKVNKKGVVIVNKIPNDELSEEAQNILLGTFSRLGVKNVCVDNQYDSNKYNISIIHESDYYSTNNLKDDYYSRLYVQHLMLEKYIKENQKTNFQYVNIPDVVIKKLIYELMIKEDLLNKKLSLYQWNHGKTLHYAQLDEMTYKNDNSCFLVLSVFPSGELEYKYLLDSEDELYKVLKKAVDFHNAKFVRKTDLDGIVSDGTNTVLIENNDIFTVPDLDELYSILNRFSKDKHIRKDLLIELLKDFENSYPGYDNDINEILKGLNSSNKTSYTYEEIANGSSKENAVKPLLFLKTKIAKDFVLFVKQKSGLIINPLLRHFENEDIISSTARHIQVFHNDMDVLDESIFYFVGIKNSLQSSIANAFHIRCIIPVNCDSSLANSLIDQLNVNFVRINENTVMPFPFKYLREAHNNNKA